jgi:DNA N-6-adenine-methyltransferase (Dam)
VDKNKWQTPEYLLKLPDQLWGENNWIDPFPSGWREGDICATSFNWDKPAFINPPYGRTLMQKWVNHAVKQPVQQLWLVNADSSTQWWRDLTAGVHGVCLLHRRVRFINPETRKAGHANPRPQALIYRSDFIKKHIELKALSDLGNWYFKTTKEYYV